MPPYPGIGARRWSKFGKYMAEAGVDVFFISAKRHHSGGSPWLKDITKFSDRILYINPVHPKVLGTIPKNLIEKIRYRAALFYSKRKYGRYNYFDPSSGFGYRVTPILEEKIKQGYINIMVSCGPFHMAHEIIQLKKKYPQVNFIADFRDPWANNKTSFGFTTIGEDRLREEYKLEFESVTEYDKVITVSDEMRNYFIAVAKQDSDKYITIPNGFDYEDFKVEHTGSSSVNDKIKFVFTGTLYERTRHILEELVSVLQNIKSSDSELYDLLKFDFYGKVPDWFFEVTNPCEEKFNYGGEIELSAVYSKISESDVCCLFLTDDLAYSRSTKFYEYLIAGKPLVVFSKDGETAQFISRNNIGYSCISGHMKDGIYSIYNDWRSKCLKRNPDFDISDWDVKRLADKVVSILI